MFIFLPVALILAVGGTDRSIRIWTRSDQDVRLFLEEYPYHLTIAPFQFVYSVSLSGHEDWVKSLAWRESVPDDNLLVLASGSQDSTIRLWNIDLVM